LNKKLFISSSVPTLIFALNQLYIPNIKATIFKPIDRTGKPVASSMTIMTDGIFQST